MKNQFSSYMCQCYEGTQNTQVLDTYGILQGGGVYVVDKA